MSPSRLNFSGVTHEARSKNGEIRKVKACQRRIELSEEEAVQRKMRIRNLEYEMLGMLYSCFGRF